ncbi:hypothetical protein [Spirosoma sp.]|uniref:hypothetical protein n=1 Tax=Spirosoma sp. TaxID=1899569 RepID=UPI003B3BAE9A
MISKGKQLSKRSKELSARFKMAYERLSFTQRQAVKVSFCKAHGVTEGTFRNKTGGNNPVSETEVEWMEAYNPYAQPLAA